MSKRSDLRKAVATYLRAFAWPVAVTINSDRLVASYELEDLVDRPVLTVIPATLRSELAGRAAFDRTLTVAVGVQQKLRTEDEVAHADQLLDLVELVMTRLEQLQTSREGLDLAPWASLEEIESDVPYEEDDVREGVFTSIVAGLFVIGEGR